MLQDCSNSLAAMQIRVFITVFETYKIEYIIENGYFFNRSTKKITSWI